jgi:hypothetical protein
MARFTLVSTVSIHHSWDRSDRVPEFGREGIFARGTLRACVLASVSMRLTIKSLEYQPIAELATTTSSVYLYFHSKIHFSLLNCDLNT